MFTDGAVAVAVIRNQVTVVRAIRAHSKREKFFDVYAYTPFGEGVFLASEVPSARVASSDVLSVLPVLDDSHVSEDMIQLPAKAYTQFLESTSKHQKRSESLWTTWLSKN